jgi:hypothetical protein
LGECKVQKLSLIVAVTALLALGAPVAGAQTQTQEPFRPDPCAKHTDAQKREDCQKRIAERKAKREAARNEARAKLNAACASATDKPACLREERAKTKAAKAKARKKPAPQ